MADGLNRDTEDERDGSNGESEANTVGWEKNGIARRELVHFVRTFRRL